MTERELQAIVVDTNVVGPVLNEKRVHQLGKWAADRNAVVIVPEVVVWELAEHSHALASEQRASLRAAARILGPTLRTELLPELPAEASIERVLDLVRESLSRMRGVQIREPTDSHAWRSAVEDQILLRRIGERRNEVKTGAADSLILALIEELIEEFGDVAIWTSDKRLGAASSELGALAFRQYPDLLTFLLQQIPTTDLLRTKTLEALRQEVAEELAAAQEPELTSEGVTVYGLSASDHWQSPVQEIFEVRDVRDIDLEVDDAFTDSTDGGLVISADVTGRALVETTQWYVDHDGQLMSQGDGFEAELMVPILATWEMPSDAGNLKDTEADLSRGVAEGSFDYEASAECILRAV